MRPVSVLERGAVVPFPALFSRFTHASRVIAGLRNALAPPSLPNFRHRAPPAPHDFFCRAGALGRRHLRAFRHI
ncbi:hypothetical protein DB771_06115 [Burkholderia sp. AU29985]|nr:hypothetical protein AK34_176 [Burkholderia dolosa AU0158]AKE02557.1 hypothetical protein XM57_06125 [Burkholderia cepacia]AYZ97305.1 hypothetical protein EGY28_19970 [Burkholderia dolosa]ETP66762.1 hypothetical protein BDSB_02675 [Burkholderia dolosa PC543]PRE52787.1 hypothetical protein C6P87_07770 [Burkholderia sp. AU12872]PUA77658.1 hypothetical protein DB771_06115 [Burkholderia sp. AU29985]